MSQTDTAAIPISARNWAALATLTLPLLLIAIDSTVLNFAVPAISEALNPTSDQLLWIVDIYSFILAGLLVSMGSLGDRIGRRKLLIIGSAGFGAASILAAYAPTAELLILARLLLGIAGATLMPSTLSLIRNIFVNRRQRRVAIGVWSAAASGGAALGPIVGGIMLEHFWWGSVFLINIPVMALLLVVAPLLLPESKSPTAGRFDLISPVLLLGAMFPLVYAIKVLAGHGMSAEVAIFAVIGVLMLVLFLRRQGRLEHPLLDLSLFRTRLFSVGIAVNLMSVFALIGGFFVITQFLQLVLGYSPLEAALWILPCLLAEILTALLAAQFVRFVPLHILLAIALLLVAAGVLLATVTGDGLPMIVFGVGMGILGLGTGTAYTLSEDAIISSAPADRAGSAAGVSETAYELGGALGVALLGTVLSIGYASHLVLPEGLTAAQGESAKQTIGGAFSVAGQLPADTANQLTEAAKQAFIFGSTAVGYAAGTLIVCTAILAFFFMREPARVTTRGAEPAP